METNVKKLLLEKDFIPIKNERLKNYIENILTEDTDKVLDFFSNYIHWNGIFAGLVSNLSSRFHLSLDLASYGDGSIEEKFLKSNAHKVAGLIFAAAEDEYADENCKEEDRRVEHKTMAWFTLNKMYEFYGKNISDRKISKHMDWTMSFTKKGYGLGESSDLMSLVNHLGFHIGSEKLASYEFGILADKMKQELPALTTWLENQELCKGVNAFSWVEVHGPVEDAHANYALDAAQIIVDEIGKKDKDLQIRVLSELSSGFLNFASIQEVTFFELSNSEVKTV